MIWFGLATACFASSPINDSFAGRIVLPSASTVAVVAASNLGATLEPGEVSPGGIGSASVWYEWTAPSTGWFTVHTVATQEARNLDTVIGIFTGGPNLSGLQMLGFNDESGRLEDFPFGLGPSRLVFRATAGTAYKMAIHGYSYENITRTGPFELHIAPRASLDFKVLGATFTPDTVDVTSAAASVQATIMVETSSAFASATVRALSLASNGPSVGVMPSDRMAGSTTNGTYTVSLGIPPGMPAGAAVAAVSGPTGDVWTPEGNDAQADHFLIPGTGGRLMVVNTGGADTIGPSLVAFSGLPANVDITGGAVPVTLAIAAADLGSGVMGGSITLDAGMGGFLLATFDASDLIGGNHVVHASIPVDLALGTYTVTIDLIDSLGNFRSFGAYGEDLPPGANGQVMVIGTPPSGYAAWALDQDFGPGGDSGLLGDPNADGTVNLLCYAFHLPPFPDQAVVMSPATGIRGLPSFTVQGSGSGRRLRLEFLRRKNPGNGLIYRPQFGATMATNGAGGWTDAAITIPAVSINDDWERVVVLDPVTGAGPRFGRVVVESMAAP